MPRSRKLLVTSLLAALATAGAASAASPTVESVVPGVGPRGGEFTVVLTGGRLKGACELLLYEKGLVCSRVEVVSDNEVKATLSAPRLPIGGSPVPAPHARRAFRVESRPRLAFPGRR